MSYEQKYLKYKQKYQELKKNLNLSNVHKMPTEVDIHDFVLTDTPTMESINMKGGAMQEEPIDYTLTDTPTVEQIGGMAPLVPATFGPTVPLTSCPGMVNPMPDVSMGLSGMMANLAANPQGPVVPAPVPAPVQVAGGDEVVSEEFNTTTDVSEIQNTEDIERLFNQFGGKRGRPSKNTESEHTEQSGRSGRSGRSKHSHSSSSESSGSSSTSLSDFDDSLTVSDL